MNTTSIESINGIEFLKDFNDWLRDEGRYNITAKGDIPAMPDGEQVSKDIDWACEQIKEYQILKTDPLCDVSCRFICSGEAKSSAEALENVRSAILIYYAALDRREHGGEAQDKAFKKIEGALGMHWEQGASLRSAGPVGHKHGWRNGMSHYAERNIIAQGTHYLAHISAMTGEGLHDKSDIAAELAHRDIQIARLTKHRDVLIGLLKEAYGYTTAAPSLLPERIQAYIENATNGDT